MSPLAAPSGSVRDSSYAELIKQLHDDRLTGSLTLRHAGEFKTTYFRDGLITFARSGNREDRLGEFLLRRGVVNLRQYLDSAERISPDKRQGAILCEMGAISAEELVGLVRDQVTEIVYSLFSWSDGGYEVRVGTEHAKEIIVLNLPLEKLVFHGIRRITDWGRIWSGLGESIDARFTLTETAGRLSYQGGLNDDESHVLGLVNGALSVGQIVDLSYGTSFETCRTLWALSVIGAIVPARLGATEPGAVDDYVLEEMVESYARVFSFIYGFVSDRISDLVDHFMDRAVSIARETQPDPLHGVNLHNQGRVEYEQVFANLRAEDPEGRLAEAGAALTELGGAMVHLTARELGGEEELYLRDQLRLMAREFRSVPVEDILTRAACMGSPEEEIKG